MLERAGIGPAEPSARAELAPSWKVRLTLSGAPDGGTGATTVWLCGRAARAFSFGTNSDLEALLEERSVARAVAAKVHFYFAIPIRRAYFLRV